MDAYSDPRIHTIVCMKSAQVGWTEIINNVVGYVIDQNPGPMLLIQPTLEMAQTWSKDRLAPMLRDTKRLQNKVKDPRSRDSGNTMLHKTFPGGHITMAGANSPASLASRPIRDVLCDEVDRYPPSAGSEGDPINLAKKRTTTFYNRKILIGSTPTIKGHSRIEMAFEDSDQRRYYVPCPECDEMQTLKWSNIQWDEGQPHTARYVCDCCGVLIAEKHKHKMLAGGEWIAANNDFPGVAGFHINELYSPWRKWSEVVTDFLAAKKSPETLKTWVNTSLGESWEEEGESVEPDALYNRREYYSAPVPDGGLLLTAGIDTQDDRIELLVEAWGEGEERWPIDKKVLYGDPSKQGIWDQLDAHLGVEYEHASGVKMRIAAACIDSGGHFTQQVYKFVKNKFGRRIYAIKGKSTPGSPLVGKSSKSNMAAIPLFPVGVDTAKELIYARLRIQEPGAGYHHFPIAEWCNQEFFDQLTAEKKITKYRRGFPFQEWIKTRPRNEMLDCSVYSLAALIILNPAWKALKERFIKSEDDQQAGQAGQEINEDKQVNRRQRQPARRRGGFVGGWRK